MTQNIRKWTSLIIAIVCYYIIHEGAHLIFALIYGTFQKIRFAYWGLGIQIVTDTAAMTNLQLIIFGIAGTIATLTAGYLLAWKKNAILKSNNKQLRAIAYYTTLILLCLDPLYLSILYRFVGGGDMNSVLLTGIPETAAVIFFLALFILNGYLFLKKIYPSYKQRFNNE